MLSVEVNGKKLEAKAGETILTAARRAGIEIPTLCHVEGLSPTGACRICVVEVEGYPNLLPACSYPLAPDMKIWTHAPRALQARRTVVQLLLSNHPDDCLYCARTSNCELQRLARDLGVDRRLFRGARSARAADVAGPSIRREPDKCILCGKCVRVCEEIQSVAAIDFIGRGSKAFVGSAFNRGLGNSSCVNCGQCVTACPTAALTEVSQLEPVLAALRDPEKMVVVQHAPAVSVTLAEEFGVKPGRDVDGQMVAALRRVGFARVFDTSFAADLTIMEEGSELVDRIQRGGTLPMLTSCSPGWIKFVETFYPDLIPNLSTCKSPQQMLGAVIKSYFAQRENLDPRNIVSVSIMPCTAKKFEAGRSEMAQDYVPDVDYVLTTREAARLLRMYGVDLMNLEPEGADTPFGERTTAGKIFGASGGVMEAAIRSAHFLITGRELKDLTLQPLRGLEGAKELHAKLGELEIGAAVVSGLGNARQLLEQIRAGRKDLQFIEVMTCPGGCINGGGQPLGTDLAAIKARMKTLYALDRDEQVRTSHSNKSVKRLYQEFLGKPLGEKSHHLLHTHYHQRDVLL
jgi:NADH-quinone oxidoreductase subunit G/NADP-reducing hydrogenase subunit HndD